MYLSLFEVNFLPESDFESENSKFFVSKSYFTNV